MQASLCGHYDIVKLLLESGALCERDTFQGERCIYNALNDKIKNLLLKYDYSKATSPLQPIASHITSLLNRDTPNTSDFTLTAGTKSWNLHKFILSARSPFFQKKLQTAENAKYIVQNTIPAEAVGIALRHIYLDEIPHNLGLTAASRVSEDAVLVGIDKIGQLLETESLWKGILAGSNNGRISRQTRQAELVLGQKQFEAWYHGNVLRHKIEVDTSMVNEVKWSRSNTIFADVLLRADEQDVEEELEEAPEEPVSSLPIGPFFTSTVKTAKKSRKSTLFPVHRAMLGRSEYFVSSH